MSFDLITRAGRVSTQSHYRKNQANAISVVPVQNSRLSVG